MKTVSPARQRRRAIIGSTIGGALEWYDFTLYGLASALVIGPLFFPSSSSVSGTLISLATFGVGFFARPVGGIIFGNLGDRLGRRKILVVSLILMSVSTFLIGCLPGYHTAGVISPVLLVLLRIGQGIGAGSEYAGATLLAAEYAPDRHRGLFAAIPAMGAPLGVILAGLVFGGFSALPNDQFLAWGWRVPFLLSSVLFVVGLWIRMYVQESPVFEANTQHQSPERRIGLVGLLRHHPIPLLKALMISVGPNATSYLPAVLGVSYLSNTLGLGPSTGTNAVIISNIGALIMLPLVGTLADRIGRRPISIFGAVLVIVLAFPFFALLDTKNPTLIVLAFVLFFSVAGHCMLGTQASLLPEQFPTEVRYSGIAVSREMASAIVGGTLPFVATALIAATGGTAAVSILVMVIAAVTLTGGLLVRESRGSSLLTLDQGRGSTTDEGAVQFAKPAAERQR